jgi:group I intron endonuclease
VIGIYKITNPNGKIYIGQSINIEKRFYRYSIVSSNVNKQTKLYRSLLKYGVDNHKFEIIEKCECDELNEKERHYQELYNCVDNGLNCYYTSTNDKTGSPSLETLKRMSDAQKGNQNWLGKKHNQQAKDKISKGNTGKKHSDIVNLSKGRKGRVSNRKGIFSENHPNSKKIFQCDLNGNVIKVWPCIMDVVRELNYSAGNISSVCNGRLKTYKKSIWKF